MGNKKLTFAVIIIITIFIIRSVDVFSDKGAHREINLQSVEVPKSVFVIGNHIIDINGFSKDIYDIAMKSSNDKKVYYKSEFANGNFVDITDLNSVDKVIKAETNFDVLKNLVTYYTDKEGKTYDLHSKVFIEPYDILNPYDVKSMYEIRPLVDYYNKLDDENLKKPIEAILNINVTSEKTQHYDDLLKSLDKYRLYLEQKNIETLQIVTIIKMVDNTRRLEVFEKLFPYFEKNYKSRDMFLEIAYKESYENVRSSLNYYKNEVKKNTFTTFNKFRDLYYSKLSIYIYDNDYENADIIYSYLLTMYNILNSNTVDLEIELEVLDKLISSATYIEYLGIKKFNEDGHDILSRLELLEIEIEFFIEQRLLRTKDKLNFINKLIDDANGFEIYRDDFYEDSQKSKQGHIKFLENIKKTLEIEKQSKNSSLEIIGNINVIEEKARNFFKNYYTTLDEELISYMKKLDDSHKLAVYLDALNMYIEATDNLDAKYILNKFLVKDYDIFLSLISDERDYLSLESIAKFKNMTYIENTKTNKFTVANQGKYYTFTGGKNTVLTDNGPETMNSKARVSDGIYIEKKYAEDTFNIKVINLLGCRFSFITDSTTKKLSNELFNLLLN